MSSNKVAVSFVTYRAAMFRVKLKNVIACNIICVKSHSDMLHAVGTNATLCNMFLQLAAQMVIAQLRVLTCQTTCLTIYIVYIIMLKNQNDKETVKTPINTNLTYIFVRVMAMLGGKISCANWSGLYALIDHERATKWLE